MCPVSIEPSNPLEVHLTKIEDCLDLCDAKHKVYQEYAWKSIERFLTRYSISSMNEVYLHFLVKLSIKLAGVYNTQIKLRDSYFKRKRQIRKAKSTVALFKKIVAMIFNNKREFEYNIIVEAFDCYELWFYEPFCTKITSIYLDISKKNAPVIKHILFIVETYFTENEMFPKLIALLNIMSTLACKDKNKFWPKHEYDIIERLINIHVRCIETKHIITHAMEICIKRILSISPNVMLLFTIDHILDVYFDKDIADLNLNKIEFSIKFATTSFINDECLWTAFKYDTLINILSLIASENKVQCNFGNETFQNILDSKRNLPLLRNMRIFFMPINYNLKIKGLDNNNRDFITRYRKELHLAFLTAIKNHSDDIKIVNSVYTSLCLLITEIPCDYTAAMLVCLSMNIQKNALADPEISGPPSHRIHAMVISIMSLICWATNASMLYCYLNKILKLRASNAPFLNPPLKTKYNYATHYVLWNKPDFFFDNFEVRYALWKRFRLNEKSIGKVISKELNRKYTKKGSYYRPSLPTTVNLLQNK